MDSANRHTSFATDRVLLAAITGPEACAQLPGDVAMLRQLDRSGSRQAHASRLAAALSRAATTNIFAIQDVTSGAVLGFTGFSTIIPEEKRATLAPIWSTGRMDEAMLVSHVAHLMTRFAFEVLAVERAELHLEWRLRRNLDLYTGLGFRCEGRLRAYFATDDGRSADAASLSVVRSEWPAIADRQRQVLAGEAWRGRLPSDRPS
ncbi:GNAT family N-acetyltransferase [Bradyrhizobium sp. WSM 1704]|uniref:GNAT family N-acetyltransferase n=1 Tax=Bradyrhizobium semiaridum TaxID=2821404 RepID=UPI001CE276C7|nr:GNAT family protein [Bradyrhizobium semiaridum]MCA6124290.1 GNAT family N-acetyltransferase [Bradyrhizobium semiaridum]